MNIRSFRVTAVAVAVASALALSGCAGEAAPSEGEEANSTAIITANGSEPQNPLIPTNTNEVGGGKILDNIFAGLVYYDAEGTPINDAAESIETEDATTFTIKIKPDLTFTNGDPVDSESFVKAWQYGALLSNAQLSSYFFEDIVYWLRDRLRLRNVRSGRLRLRRHHVHRDAQRRSLRLPAAPRLLGVLPAARVGLGRPRRLR